MLIVANGGLDGPTCGSKTSPCRSITQAIAQAAAGDKIEVGPGRYGDVNGDGVLGQPGEEGATCAGACLVYVHKRVTILSRDGAGATIIEGKGTAVAAVVIAASGVRFGKAGRGLTVRAGSADGFLVPGGTSDIRIEGCVSHGHFGDGFRIGGSGSTLVGNQASGDDAGFTIEGSGHLLVRNVARDNGGGFGLRGTDHVLIGNVARDNRFEGFAVIGHLSSLRENVATSNRLAGFGLIAGPHLVTENIAVGNGGAGFDAGGVLYLSGNTAAGNMAAGILVRAPLNAVRANNLIGNGKATFGALSNCGLENASGAPLSAVGSFWASPGGPGTDPADDVCDTVAGSVTSVVPFASKELRVRSKSAR